MSDSHEEDANKTPPADVVGETCNLPVTGVTPSAWGPSWLRELDVPPSIAASGSASMTPHSLNGWRLRNGTVLCAECNPQPHDACPVSLFDTGDGPVWRELLTEPNAMLDAETVTRPPSTPDALTNGNGNLSAVTAEGPLTFV